MRSHPVELAIARVPVPGTPYGLPGERAEFRCLRCGAALDLEDGGWVHVERMRAG